MARRKTNTQPPPGAVRQFTLRDVEKGIRKLNRRIEEVKGLDPSKVRYDDQSVKNVTLRINETLSEVFGANYSPKFRGFGPRNTTLGGMSEAGLQNAFAEAIPRTVTMLEGRISYLEEEREDLEAEQSGCNFPGPVNSGHPRSLRGPWTRRGGEGASSHVSS